MVKKNNAIRFSAKISQMRAKANGVMDVVFSISSKEVEAQVKLLEAKQNADIILEIAAVPVVVKENKELDGKEKIRPLPKEQDDTPIDNLSHDDLAMLLEYFSNGMIGTRAWMETHPNSKYASAAVSASEWLKKPKIQAEITRLLNEKAMSLEEALARTSEIARASLLPFLKVADDGFTYFNFADPEAKSYIHIIKKMKTKRERRIVGAGDSAEEWEGEWVEVELLDSQSAQRDILKMHGKFIDKIESRNISIIDDFILDNIDLFTDGQIKRIQKGEDKSGIVAELLRSAIENRKSNEH